MVACCATLMMLTYSQLTSLSVSIFVEFLLSFPVTHYYFDGLVSSVC